MNCKKMQIFGTDHIRSTSAKKQFRENFTVHKTTENAIQTGFTKTQSQSQSQ